MTKTIPDDVKAWIETEGQKIYDNAVKKGWNMEISSNYCFRFEEGATAMYNRDREEIERHEKRMEFYEDLLKKHDEGRDYLMSVDPKKLTVEDCLEAFGFQRNGL